MIELDILDEGKKECIDFFVKNCLEGDHEILLSYINILNTKRFAEKLMPFREKYGPRGDQMIHELDCLRDELELSYKTVKSEIQQRLYD